MSTDPSVVTPSEGQRARAAWEERATVYSIRIQDCDITLILLDPQPIINHSVTGEWIVPEGEGPQSNKNIFETRSEMLLPYTPVAPRGPDRNKPSRNHIFDILGQLNTARSTREDLIEWIQAGRDCSGPDAILGLVQIVHGDILGLLHLMAMILERINLDTMVDSHVVERLSHWRALVNRFQIELASMRSTLEPFIDFVYGTEAPTPVAFLVSDANQRIDKSLIQLEGFQNSLRAEVSVLESKRGINEAESVSKLTELAFFFIPITFVASTFSMQIKELQQAASLSSFILASAVAIGFSYGLRLVVRSSILLRYKRECFNNVRKYGRLGAGSRISTHVFLLWLLDRASLRWVFQNFQRVVAVGLSLSVLICGPVAIALIWALGKTSIRRKVLFTTLVLMLVCSLLVLLILKSFRRYR
ncbi:hypothetical protein AOQ84DRAFT_30365 [Glonium stellatum]|uniref:Uncharacterized protein n=1 Tax=Glonium stellatum TaxID=574774 RepID=A0A8E2F2B8_9PEZI|nr:hypothetical protein AOQ84DRAFT_30365 [Glonium stellatum]